MTQKIRFQDFRRKLIQMFCVMLKKYILTGRLKAVPNTLNTFLRFLHGHYKDTYVPLVFLLDPRMSQIFMLKRFNISLILFCCYRSQNRKKLIPVFVIEVDTEKYDRWYLKPKLKPKIPIFGLSRSAILFMSGQRPKTKNFRTFCPTLERAAEQKTIKVIHFCVGSIDRISEIDTVQIQAVIDRTVCFCEQNRRFAISHTQYFFFRDVVGHTLICVQYDINYIYNAPIIITPPATPRSRKKSGTCRKIFTITFHNVIYARRVIPQK